jgi:hypothetical protein
MSKEPKTLAQIHTDLTKNADGTNKVIETVSQLKAETQVKPEVSVVPSFNVDTLKSLTTVSAKVRYLDKCGLTRGQIVKTFPVYCGRTILYQHVRNVLITPVKKA